MDQLTFTGIGKTIKQDSEIKMESFISATNIYITLQLKVKYRHQIICVNFNTGKPYFKNPGILFISDWFSVHTKKSNTKLPANTSFQKVTAKKIRSTITNQIKDCSIEYSHVILQIRMMTSERLTVTVLNILNNVFECRILLGYNSIIETRSYMPSRMPIH